MGRYAVEETVGSGGTSTVFRAVDMQLHRTVAIKVLLPELSFGLGEDRFLREIDTAARLSHPRIVPLFASGQVSGLLYYVMPFIEGESLRRRLERERQFPIEDALRITHEVGEALHYAHSHGVVHRDITPGNVMLTEAGAVVMDFGIAKSSESTDPSPITQTGQVVGTLGYMSPEQASGERNLDSRSDLYSLACLLYEMLAGEAPYSGSNARAILAKQLAQPVSSVRIVRDTVPVAVDLALQRAMAKSAADRFASVHEFLDALDSEAKPDRSPDRGQRMKRAGWAAAAMLILAVGTWLTVTRGGSIASDADVAPDTSLYALFPFQRPEGSTTDLNEVQRLEDALDHWDGLGVVSQLQLREALADLDDDLTIETAARLAAEYGAGRFIWGEIQPLGDSVRVRAGLYDAASNGVQLEDQAFRVAATLEHADSLFRVMARELLFRGDPPDDEHAFASRSLPALKDLRRGLRAVSEWDLAAADAAFESARKNDSEYASASLWVALVRRWRGRPETEWVVAANQAFLRRSQLSDAERSAADAVMSAVTGDLGAACPLWDQMTEAEPDSFVNWYGLAHCLAQDSAVVRDPESPSGWAFRTSYSQALAAHEEAFRLQPAILASFQRTSYEPLQNLYMVGGNQRRGGWSDSLEFYADPVWTSDTLGFVPYPRVAGGGGPVSDLAEASEAVTQLRLKLVRVARTWSSQAPGDGHAKHALGLALALIGDARPGCRREFPQRRRFCGWTDESPPPQPPSTVTTSRRFPPRSRCSHR